MTREEFDKLADDWQSKLLDYSVARWHGRTAPVELDQLNSAATKSRFSLRDSVLTQRSSAPELLAMLEELEGSFDEQTYQEKAREDFDAPDDREYCVNITAKQLRAISRAIAKATSSPPAHGEQS